MMNAPVEESVEHDVHKSEEEVPYVNVEHDELKDDFHQKLEIRELCIEPDQVVDKPVPIDVEIEATSILVEKLIMENTELVEMVNELYVKLERQNMAAGHPTVIDMSDSLPQSIEDDTDARDFKSQVIESENNTVPLIDAPLIGAPFQLMSFVTKYVTGADLVNNT
ncbi:hypothetical protein PVK06_008491 [Gossypium arboreum]|uniref:Uncharacterized protein n=1 Tax=Gossypium arboreum TaxID=29729 RepID=A0ABR0QK38_GOSAR|nr:hypothetical protein PVK06_008491 [Gossypium arboreum]